MSDLLLEGDMTIVRPSGRFRRFGKRFVFVLVAFGAVAAAAWFARDWWTDGRFIESTDDAYIGGNVTAISPHVAGFVAQILVADNQPVQAGQILVRLDDKDMRASADHFQALVEERRAVLAALKARVVLQQSAIRQASAEVEAKAALAAFSRQDAKRYSSLVNTTAVTRQDTDRSSAADEQAKAAVQSAQAALDGARQQVDVLNAQIAEANAALAQAAADLQTAHLNLGYTEIRSPIDGFAGNRAAQEGAYVSVGTYLLTIVPARGLWIDANFKEDQLGRIRPGDRASVVADVMPGRVIHGRVASVAPGTGAVFSVIPPENATGNFTKIVQRVPVRIALEADDAILDHIRPGLSVTVSVDTRHGGTFVK
jgi:membrane fusion protein (multidrug efflux system)